MKIEKLGNICEIIGGNAAPKDFDAFGNIGIPFVKMKDLGKYHLTNNLIETENKVTPEIAEKNKLKLIKKGAILIPRSGSVALNHRALLGTDAYMVSHICALEVKNKNEVHNQYLYYYLSTISFDRITKKTTGLDAITFQDLAKVEIPIPNLLDQLRIATLLSKIEFLIAKRKQSIDFLDKFLKNTFREMFGNISTNTKKFKTGIIRDVVTEVKYGTSQSSDSEGKYPYIRMNNITVDGYMDYTNLKYIDIKDSEKEKYIVKKGDLLFNRTNSKELVGKTGVYNEDKEMVIAGYLIRARTNKKANPWYLWGYLNSKHGKQTLFAMCKSIVGMANINAQELQDIKILIPPITLQDRFANIVEKTFDLKKKQSLGLLELENLFGSISQRAFSGEIDLSLVPIEEEWSNFSGDEPEETDPKKRAKIKKYFEKELKRLELDSLEGKEYGDPFSVDEVTAKKAGKEFYAEWKKLNQSIPLERQSWEEISEQQRADWIKKKYYGYHFSSEMLIRFLEKEYITSIHYYSSEELKKHPNLNTNDEEGSKEDLKSFLFKAIKGETYLHLEQKFYNAEKPGFKLNLTKEDEKLFEERAPREKSGIYFNLVEK